jgi:AraC-like DNA-binding protein/ligand-binding sensor domain-containing protein
MWMLTQGGLDRYNGKTFKHFELDRQEEFLLAANIEKMELTRDERGNILVMGISDKIFRFDEQKECFVRTPMVKSRFEVIQHNVDQKQHIWASDKQHIYRYDIDKKHTHTLPNPFRGREEIESIECGRDSNTLYIATSNGIYRWDKRQKNGCRQIADTLRERAQLYYHARSRQLVIAPFSGGVYLYSETTGTLHAPTNSAVDGVTVTQMIQDTKYPDELLLATEGAGVCKLHLSDRTCRTFIAPNEALGNKMTGNIIRSLYMEGKDRLWMGVSPYGVTIFSYKYPPYRWIIHAAENEQSLGNNQVNGIYEDSDGDIWYLTGNGISIYTPATRRWRHILQAKQTKGNSVFLSLCETAKGEFLAGGAFNGVYAIRKPDFSYRHYTQNDVDGAKGEPLCNRNIRCIFKDSKGDIWMGGYYYLSCINPKTKAFRRIGIKPRTTCFAEKDPRHLWVGTTEGLYTVDTETKRAEKVVKDLEHCHITTLYKLGGMTYIGTKNQGLYVLNAQQEVVKHLQKENSALLSNHITNIEQCYSGKTNSDYVHEYRALHGKMPGDVKAEITSHYLMICTEQEIAVYSTYHGDMKIWPKDQGVVKIIFNDHAVAHTDDHKLILGSNYGGIELPDTLLLPDIRAHEIRIEEITINDIPYTGDKSKPLKLKHDERNLCVEVNCINYENPSDVIIRWRLKKENSTWNELDANAELHINDLSSGSHTLQLEAISKGSHTRLAQKELKIKVARSVWLSWWMILLYILFIGGPIVIFLLFRKIERDNEKMNNMIKVLTASTECFNNIQMHLSDIYGKENLSSKGQEQLLIVVRNVIKLIHIAQNFVDKESAELGLFPEEEEERTAEEAKVTPSLSEETKAENTDGEEGFLNRVDTHISEHLHQSDYTVNALCQDMGMSRSALCFKLKDITGHTPGDYIRLYRLKKAEVLLSTHLYSISEVSYRCGFGDAKYFREVFKKYYNMTPTEYIRKNKKGKKE